MPQPQAIFWTSLYCSKPTWLDSSTQPLSHFPSIYRGISMVTATEGQVYQTLGFNLGGWIGEAQTERHHKENLIVIWVNGQTQVKLTAEMTRQTKRIVKSIEKAKYESNKCHRQGRSNYQHLLIVPKKIRTTTKKILRHVWKTTIYYRQSIIFICTIKSQCVVVGVGTDCLRRSQAKLLEKKSSVLELRRPPVTLSSYQIK